MWCLTISETVDHIRCSAELQLEGPELEPCPLEKVTLMIGHIQSPVSTLCWPQPELHVGELRTRNSDPQKKATLMLTTIQSSAVEYPLDVGHSLSSNWRVPNSDRGPPKEGHFEVGHTTLRSAVSTLCWPQQELQWGAPNSSRAAQFSAVSILCW